MASKQGVYSIQVEPASLRNLFQTLNKLDKETQDDIRSAALPLSQRLAGQLLMRFPGCGSLSFNISHNKAGAHGGAVYVDGCRENRRCFLDGLGPLSGTRASIFNHNIAGKGGGALFMACSSFSSQKLNTAT